MRSLFIVTVCVCVCFGQIQFHRTNKSESLLLSSSLGFGQIAKANSISANKLAEASNVIAYPVQLKADFSHELNTSFLPTHNLEAEQILELLRKRHLHSPKLSFEFEQNDIYHFLIEQLQTLIENEKFQVEAKHETKKQVYEILASKQDQENLILDGKNWSRSRLKLSPVINENTNAYRLDFCYDNYKLSSIYKEKCFSLSKKYFLSKKDLLNLTYNLQNSAIIKMQNDSQNYNSELEELNQQNQKNKYIISGSLGIIVFSIIASAPAIAAIGIVSTLVGINSSIGQTITKQKFFVPRAQKIRAMLNNIRNLQSTLLILENKDLQNSYNFHNNEIRILMQD